MVLTLAAAQELSTPSAAPPPRRIDISVMRWGELTRLHIVDDRLRVEASGSAAPRARRLTKDEIDRVRAAARLAVEQDRRLFCDRREIFISVTVDGKTSFAPICPEKRRGDEPWRELFRLAHQLASDNPGDSRRM